MIDVNYKLIIILFLTVVFLIGAPMVAAKSSYLTSFNQNYNTTGTKLDSCNTCHVAGESLNPYGRASSENGRNFAAIETLDLDNDGFTNAEEINALTFPGNPDDYPQTTPAMPDATTPNITQEQTVTEVPISNITLEKPTTEVPANNTAHEKPTASVPVSNITETPKSPGFESMFAFVGFFIIVGLHRKYA